jgi:hypothetical protein
MSVHDYQIYNGVRSGEIWSNSLEADFALLPCLHYPMLVTRCITTPAKISGGKPKRSMTLVELVV